MKKIAIQGLRGSFHDIASHRHFGGEELDLLCCASFEEVFQAIKEDPDTIGLVAIENTIAGSLLHNYELLLASGLQVVGEHKLHISHCLCCLPEDDWDTLEEVHSHPVALMQCRRFLSGHSGIKAVEDEDTAGSAKWIAENNVRHTAAICHAEAARMYGLKVLEDHIEDNKHNYTRFLVVCHASHADQMRRLELTDKSSLVFSLPHEEGSLSMVLSILTFYKVNLTKIQSLPIIGREWEYLFYVDVRYDDLTRYHQSIEALRPLTRELKILGEYVAY